MTAWPPVDRDDLRRMAGDAGFDTVLPILVRRLIAETGRGVTELDMPGGSGTAVGGFDGVVTAGEATTFVPAGRSVWELSVQRDAQGKAVSDYGKRLTGPEGQDPAEVTYVQVILAPWTKARSWAAQCRAQGRWRDVRACNLDDLTRWLEQAPATTAWLAEQRGMALPGVQALDTWWEDCWLPSTAPPLPAEVVVAGRGAAADRLLELLGKGKPLITLEGGLRRDELRAFVAASVRRLRGHEQAALGGRVLLVDSADALAQLLRRPGSLVLIVADPVLLSDLPGRHEHRIITAAAVGVRADLTVPRVDDEAVAEHLVGAGVTRQRAWRHGALARRSLSALRREIALRPQPLIPSWAQVADTTRCRLLLVGGWDGGNPHDREVLETLTGLSYRAVRDMAEQLAQARDIPMVAHFREEWHVLSPEDSWNLLGRYLTKDDLDAFAAVCAHALGAASRERGRRRRGGGQGCSALLCAGLAQTLALLGCSGGEVRVAAGLTGAGVAAAVVARLLAHANADSSYRLWDTLGDVLPLLAEAAPEEVLRALRSGLDGDAPPHAALFAGAEATDHGFPRRTAHLDVLAALQVMAWSPRHFDAVVDVLAGLAAIDPGGRWSPRPASILAGLFVPRSLFTCTGQDHRLTALRRLVGAYPQVGWTLLLTLLSGEVHTLQRREPRFRDWRRPQRADGEDPTVLADGILELLLEAAGDDPGRCAQVAARFDLLPAAQRAMFGARCVQLGRSLTDDTARASVHDALRDRLARHREYPDTAWALPEAELTVFDTAVTALRPRAAVLRVAWLFASGWVHLGLGERRDDHRAYERMLHLRRAQAAGEVFAEGGVEAIVALAETTEHRHLVGAALAQHLDDTAAHNTEPGDTRARWPRGSAPDSGHEVDLRMAGWLAFTGVQRDLAQAYLAMRLRRHGGPLRDLLLAANPSPQVRAEILLATGDAPASWRRLEDLPDEVAQRYWTVVDIYGIASTQEHILEAVQGLCGVNRHFAALHLIALHADESDTVELAETAATVCRRLLTAGSAGQNPRGISDYDVTRLVRLMARHVDALGRQRLVELEWQLFPLLAHPPEAPVLHSSLTEEPQLFTELITCCYRREHDTAWDPLGADHSAAPPGGPAASGFSPHSGLDTLPGDAEARIATRAFQVLYNWRRCPGIDADGVLDPDRLQDWVTRARTRLAEVDRTTAGDAWIGKALTYAPPDPDGTYPPRAVRDLLEDLRSDRVDTNLRIGIFNRRGIVSRSLTEGGDQERSLAGQYIALADHAVAWPRTRALLLTLADHYTTEAVEEDDEAERRRLGLPD